MVGLNSQVTGSLTVGDRDWFQFDVTSRTSMTIRAQGSTSTLLDTIVYLYDADGNLVENNDDAGFWLGGGVEYSSLITRDLEVGRYYLVVGTFDDDTAGSYRLNFSTAAPQSSTPAPYIMEGSWHDDRLVGTWRGEIIRGGEGHDFLYGMGGDDVLEGFEDNGNDTLDGGTGADQMSGGPGNDTYYVDNSGDRVIENAGQGTDIVYSSISYTLPTNVENLFLTGTAANGTGNSLANRIVGNASANVLRGEGGNDTLEGGAGNDALYGGAGADLLDGGAGDDVLDGGGGADTIRGGDGLDTAVFSGARGSYAISYLNGSISSVTLNGVQTTLSGIEQVRFSDGTMDVRPSNPLVDSQFYYLAYSDVERASMRADDHYNLYGWREGRDPSAFFATSGYLAVNSDVRAGGLNPLDHYDLYGWKEGRDASASFDTRLYLLHNPDVAAAKMDPLLHFMQFGQREGRQAYDAIGSHILANGFDAQFYLLNNSDVAALAIRAGGNAEAFAYQHYHTTGWKQGRDPNAWFDTDGYLAKYTDVAAGNLDPLDHYALWGWKEGRDPSADFDTSSYRAAYADVAAAGLNPLTHYLQYGAYEMRDTFANGWLI